MTFPYEITHEVVFHDLDMLGHVNNVTYFIYMETIRFKYMTDYLGINPTGQQMTMVVAEATCQYKSSAVYGDLLTIGIGVSRIGRSSFDFLYQMTNADGKLIATGKSVQVAYDPAIDQAVPLPEEFIAAVNKAQGGWTPPS